MSKRRDRKRAESGLIFRDGRIVTKVAFYGLEPPKAGRKVRAK